MAAFSPFATNRGAATSMGGKPNYNIDPSVLAGLAPRAIYGQTENDFGALLGYENTTRFNSGGNEYIADWDGGNMRIQPYIDTGGGWLGNHHLDRYNGTGYDIYDQNKKFQGSGTWDGLTGAPGSWAALATAIGGPLAGGALAGAAGAGAAGAGAGAAGAGAGGAAAGGAGAAGGLSSLFGGGSTLGTIGKVGSALASILGATGGGSNGGGGGGGTGGLNLGGLGLQDIIGLIGGGVDANRQGEAAEKMLAWLNGNQAKMESLYSPNSPESKYLWEEMSRKDAAAGRNSQYGPRTADFAGKVAADKAANIRNFTTGTSRAYADALNQDASKYAGLSAALQRAAGGGGGNNLNLGSLLSLFGNGGGMNLGGGINMDANGIFGPSGSNWSGGTMSNDEIWDMINGGGYAGDLGGGVDAGVDIVDWFL